MPPTLEVKVNPMLRDETIVASHDTASELRKILADTGLMVATNSKFENNVVSVSQSLYDDFSTFLRCYQQVLDRTCV